MRTCPYCGEECAQAWCGFCERALPTSCAFERCDDPDCYFCVVMPKTFATVRCTGMVDGLPCRKTAGHVSKCQPLPARKKPTKPLEKHLRDGAPRIRH